MGSREETTLDLAPVDAIVKEYAGAAAKIIPILQKTQQVYRYLPEVALDRIAVLTGMPQAKIYGVATFYANFSLKPRGVNVVRICDGTACHVKRSTEVAEALRAKYKLTAESPTLPDLSLTVETVACLGACGLAPAMLLNDKTYGGVTPKEAVILVDKVLSEGNRRV